MFNTTEESLEIAKVIYTYATIIINIFALVIDLIAIMVFASGEMTGDNLVFLLILSVGIIAVSIVSYTFTIMIINKYYEIKYKS